MTQYFSCSKQNSKLLQCLQATKISRATDVHNPGTERSHNHANPIVINSKKRASRNLHVMTPKVSSFFRCNTTRASPMKNTTNKETKPQNMNEQSAYQKLDAMHGNIGNIYVYRHKNCHYASMREKTIKNTFRNHTRL